MHIYFQYVAMYLIGQALHLLLIKIPELRKLSSANNHKFQLAVWWEKDWNVILGSALLGPSLLIGLDQLTQLYPSLEKMTMWMFWGVGILGSALAMRFSEYSKVVMKFLDLKANISDAAIGRTENKQDLIEKGIELTGVDVTKSPIEYGTTKKGR